MRPLFVPLLCLVACGGSDEDDGVGMVCEEGPSLCGTFDSSALTTPVQCTFAAKEANDFVDPPLPDNVWDEGANSFTGVEVDVLPWPWALNDLAFWEGGEMYVMVVCDSDGSGDFGPNDVQGVYGGDAAEAVVVPADGIDITL